MADARPLTVFDGPSDLFGMLCPTSSPAMSCTADPGIDWICPQCGVTLLKSFYPGQILDLLIRCFSCQKVCATEVRYAGQPLAGKPVLIPPGQYLLSSTVAAEKPVMTVGAQAIEGYVRETGSRALGSAEETQLAVEISERGLNQLADDLAHLLGDKFNKLWLKDQRGLSSKTPPKRRHRLVELIAYVRDAVGVFKDASPGGEIALDGNLLAEAIITASLFSRWQNHPAYDELVKDLADETSGQHAVMLLGLASYLVDAGNGVGIVSGESSTGRIADLWIVPTLIERLDLEIKTPIAFRGPLITALTYETAKKEIDTLIKKAASSSGGQLRGESGILSIGAYHLREKDIDVLKRATKSILAAQATRKKHLAAVTITTVSYENKIVKELPSRAIIESFSPSLQTTVIKHPGYAGELVIDQTERPSSPPNTTGSSVPQARRRQYASLGKKRKAERQARRRGRRR